MVPTLALQICSNIPSLRPFIGLTAFHYPDILSRDIYDQLEVLVFEPFRHYPSMKEGSPPAILMIDGLELYHDVETQKTLISLIETVATTSSIPLRFLLTTRRSAQEYGLSLRPGTHLHVRNGPSVPHLRRLKLALGLGASQSPNTPKFHGFPQILQSRSSQSDAESYTRSLIMLGHGIPLWRPQGDGVAHPEYHQQGPQIGDVLLVTREGGFQFLVNIFRGHDEPINNRMQERYSPLTLDSSEVTRVENHFKPGTVITSTEVVASKRCETPL